MKTRIYSSLLVLIAVFVLGCADHEVPTRKVYPTIETLEYEVISESEEEQSAVWFYVDFKEVGNQPITEYGIVMSAQNQNANVEPTVNDPKFPFSSPVTVPYAGGIIKTGNISTELWPVFIGPYRFSYRAYAITSDGTIVYGNTISEVFQPL